MRGDVCMSHNSIRSSSRSRQCASSRQHTYSLFYDCGQGYSNGEPDSALVVQPRLNTDTAGMVDVCVVVLQRDRVCIYLVVHVLHT